MTGNSGDSTEVRLDRVVPTCVLKMNSRTLNKAIVSSNNQSDSYVHHMHVLNCTNNEISQGR